MILNFDTNDESKARAAFLVYAIYQSRNREKGPKGFEMWAQIERFVRSASKRAESIDEFVQTFKRKMSCDTINPRYTRTSENSSAAKINADGSIWIKENVRDFGIDIFNSDTETQEKILDALYRKTQAVILLVRERTDREKNFEEVTNDEN